MSPFAIRTLLALALLAPSTTTLVGCTSHARVAAHSRTPPSAAAVHPRPDVTPIRSMDFGPADGADFAELRPLARAIGDARLVLIGEQTHADGTTFVAKVRMVRFLHEELGFDVLALEAGLWDVLALDRALVNSGALAPALDASVFPYAARSNELRPLFEYARRTAESARRLELAGFDPQFSGDGRGADYPRWLFAFFDRASHTLVDIRVRADVDRAFDRFPKKKSFQPLTPAEREYDRAVFQALLNLIDARETALVAAHASPVDGDAATATATAAPDLVRGREEVSLARRTLIDILALYDWHAAVGAERRTEIPFEREQRLNNVRDAAMASNLEWLVNERYRGKRVIASAADFHIMRGIDALDMRGTGYDFSGLVPMGEIVARTFGRAAYSIAFTEWVGARGTPPRAAEGSLEWLLRRDVGAPFAFVDLRGAGAKAGSWAREPLWARPIGYSSFRVDWGRVFDGIFYMETMAPATSLPAGK